jgi:hypothetical protein
LPRRFNTKILKGKLGGKESVPHVRGRISEEDWEMDGALKSRLAECCRVLELIDQKRAAAGDATIGLAVEKRILDRELRELERSAGGTGMMRTRRMRRR